jgi:hypothetical protein
MSNIITVGYITEGSTDKRFLETIIKKTVEDIAFNCEGQIDVYDPVFLDPSNEDSFISSVVSAARKAFQNGIFILCVHTDSDNARDINAFENKITPSIVAVKEVADRICKIIVPIVPITMSESWMLADKNLFKNELGTTLSDQDLNISRHPESIADPKSVIENALRIAQQNLPKRRFRLTISELYQPIGQKIDMQSLETLSSFRKFKLSVENAFRELNYIH